MTKSQFGFRSKHSTTHALLDFIDKVSNAIDDSKHTIGIFLDLSKAFDTIDHQILLHKLSFYGIRGIPLEWFRSYLSNRSQYCSINGINSSSGILTYGVPQGSILGPLLFYYMLMTSKILLVCFHLYCLLMTQIYFFRIATLITLCTQLIMSLNLQQIGLQSMGYPLILPKQTTCYLVILPVTFQVKSRLMIPD